MCSSDLYIKDVLGDTGFLHRRVNQASEGTGLVARETDATRDEFNVELKFLKVPSR